jgi:hypothetical protein
MSNRVPFYNRRHLDPAHYSPLDPSFISPTQIPPPQEEQDGFPLPSFLPTLNLPQDHQEYGQSGAGRGTGMGPSANGNGGISPGSVELESGRTTPTMARMGLGDRRTNSFETISKGLPLDFLAAYPFPAFVMLLPIPLGEGGEQERTGSGTNSLADIQFTRNAWLGSASSLIPETSSNTLLPAAGPSSSAASTSTQAPLPRDNKSRFEPIWSNSRYKSLANGRDFLDLLDTKQMVRFADWTSGVMEFERRERARSGRSRRKSRLSSRSSSRSNEDEVEGDLSGKKVVDDLKAERQDSGSKLREAFERYDVTGKTVQAKQVLDAAPADLDAGIDELSKLDPGSDEEDAVDDELVSYDEGNDEDDAPGEIDLLDGIREHVERDREASSITRSDDSDPIEDAKGDIALDIVLREPSSDGQIRHIGFTLTKSLMPTNPRSEIASLVVIQAIPLSDSVVIDGEIVSSGALQKPMAARYDNTSSTTTSQNAHRSSFPFFAQNDDDDGGDTPHASGFKWKRTQSRTASKNWNDRDVDETPGPEREYLQSEVSGLFPPAEPVILGMPDLDQLTSGPRKPFTDATSVEYLLQNTDWSKTSLGPREQWSQSLRTMLSLVQALPLQATLWWGPDLVLIYNEHYANMLQGKHPSLFGMAGAKGYAEVWSALGPVAKTVMSGVPASKDDDLFLFETNDSETPLVEYYHSCESHIHKSASID